MCLQNIIDGLIAAANTKPNRHLFHKQAHDCSQELTQVRQAILAVKVLRNIEILVSDDNPKALTPEQIPPLREIYDAASAEPAAFKQFIEQLFKGDKNINRLGEDKKHLLVAETLLGHIKSDLYKTYNHAEVERGRLAVRAPLQVKLLFAVKPYLADIKNKEPGIYKALNDVVKQIESNPALRNNIRPELEHYVLDKVVARVFQYTKKYNDKDKVLSQEIKININGEEIPLATLVQQAIDDDQKQPWLGAFRVIEYLRLNFFTFKSDPRNAGRLRQIDEKLSMLNAFEKYFVSQISCEFTMNSCHDVLNLVEPFRFSELRENIILELQDLRKKMVDADGKALRDRDNDSLVFLNKLIVAIAQNCSHYPMGEDIKAQLKYAGLLQNLDDMKLRDLMLTRLGGLYRVISNNACDIKVNKRNSGRFEEIFDILMKHEKAIRENRSPVIKQIIAPSLEVNALLMIAQKIKERVLGASDKSIREMARDIQAVATKLELLPAEQVFVDEPSILQARAYEDLSSFCFKLFYHHHQNDAAGKLFADIFDELAELAEHNDGLKQIWLHSQDQFVCERWCNRYQKYIGTCEDADAEMMRADLSTLEHVRNLSELEANHHIELKDNGEIEDYASLLMYLARCHKDENGATDFKGYALHIQEFHRLKAVEQRAIEDGDEASINAAKQASWNFHYAENNDYDGWKAYAQAELVSKGTCRQAMELRIIEQAMELAQNPQTRGFEHAKVLKKLTDRMPMQAGVSLETQLRVIIHNIFLSYVDVVNKRFMPLAEDKKERYKYILGIRDAGAVAAEEGLLDMFAKINAVDDNNIYHPVGEILEQMTDFLFEQYKILYFEDKNNHGSHTLRDTIKSAIFHENGLITLVSPAKKAELLIKRREVVDAQKAGEDLGDYQGPKLYQPAAGAAV